MSPAGPIASYLRSCARFSGRASRAEYWRVMRIILVIPAVLYVIAIAISAMQGNIYGGFFSLYNTLSSIILVIPLGVFFVLVLSPAWLAVTARRLHDTGRSARWLLVYAVIVLGWSIIVGVAVWTLSVLFGDSPDEQFGEYEGLALVLLLMAMGGVWGVASLIGMIILFALCSSHGETGLNRYGPNPLLDAEGVQAAQAAGPDFRYESSPMGSTSAEPSSSVTLCRECGEHLQSEARFCTYCGNAV